MNEIYKDLGTKLEVSSAHQESIDLKGSFSTQDIKTGLLLFDIEKDSVPLPMSSLTATIYLRGNDFVVQDICEVNKELSQVSYVLNDETIKHFGPVQAELYLRYNQGQSLSVHKFHFTIDQALMDQDLDVIYQVYIRDLEDIKDEYKHYFDNLQAELNRQLQDTQQEIAKQKFDLAASNTELNNYKASITANQVVKTSETANWQKAKLTMDTGAAKAPPDVTTLATITEQGSFYMNSVAVAKLTDAPVAGAGAFRLENHKLVTGTAIEQHARYFSQSNADANRHFFRYVGATASPWREYENTTNAQARADKALADAKTDASTKANTAEVNSKTYTDSYFASKTIVSNLAIYLSDTQSYTWNHSNMKKGLYIEVVRYTVGTGSNDYGYDEIFISKELIERRLGKPCWFAMPTSINGEKKSIKFAINGITGTLTGYASNAVSPDSGWAISNIRME